LNINERTPLIPAAVHMHITMYKSVSELGFYLTKNYTWTNLNHAQL
jgi:hypothetical protein